MPDFGDEADAFGGGTDLSTFGGDSTRRRDDIRRLGDFGGATDFVRATDLAAISAFGDSSFGALRLGAAPLGSACSRISI